MADGYSIPDLYPVKAIACGMFVVAICVATFKKTVTNDTGLTD